MISFIFIIFICEISFINTFSTKFKYSCWAHMVWCVWFVVCRALPGIVSICPAVVWILTFFLFRWDYAEAPNNSLDYNDQMRLLVPAIELVSRRRGDDVKVLIQNDRYLRVVFTDGKTGEKSSGEFYFTENDTTVQFRVGTLTPALKSSGGGGALSSFTTVLSSSTKNLDRCEMIRKELRYLKIPVLRNRKRALFFVESDLDTFGPGSAALGPPAEMTTGELEGRQDVDPKLKIDLLQAFPFQ